MTANPIVWWELAAHDAEKTVQFFRDVFDWRIDFDEKLIWRRRCSAGPKPWCLDKPLLP
ncbi:MAG: hypothetical protein HZB19_20605 [Chloroflexi bacterium]|nr:hypothetical protein [Chloroflexota bacterium]